MDDLRRWSLSTATLNIFKQLLDNFLPTFSLSDYCSECHLRLGVKYRRGCHWHLRVKFKRVAANEVAKHESVDDAMELCPGVIGTVDPAMLLLIMQRKLLRKCWKWYTIFQKTPSEYSKGGELFFYVRNMMSPVFENGCFASASRMNVF